MCVNVWNLLRLLFLFIGLFVLAVILVVLSLALALLVYIELFARGELEVPKLLQDLLFRGWQSGAGRKGDVAELRG